MHFRLALIGCVRSCPLLPGLQALTPYRQSDFTIPQVFTAAAAFATLLLRSFRNLQQCETRFPRVACSEKGGWRTSFPLLCVSHFIFLLNRVSQPDIKSSKLWHNVAPGAIHEEYRARLTNVSLIWAILPR